LAGSSKAANSDVVLRAETDADREAIATVVERAFGSPLEARLVEALRASSDFVSEWSLVAVLEQRLVGYVMVTYAAVHDAEVQHRVPNLSPLAVEPDAQRQGIGSKLVRAIAARVDNAGEPLILVEGDPRYYGRFGFVDCRTCGITITLPDWAPSDAGQILPLRNYDASIRGHVVYPPAFDNVADA
jgi:putative acetyltransferase